MNINQFAIYQLKSLPENRAIRFRPYQEVQGKGIKVWHGNYEQVYLGMMQPGEIPAGIRSRFQEKHPRNFKGHSISVSDVFVLNRSGTVAFYYVEKEGFTEFTGFFPGASSSTAVTIHTEHLEVDGKEGKWVVYDSIFVEGIEFFLLEHETYGGEAANIIVDKDGKLVVDRVTNGFDETAREQIKGYLSLQSDHDEPENPHKEPGNGKPKLETWQKYHENGEYLRSAEITEEQNYNMIDGRLTNLPAKPRKIGNRISVLDRLHLKQAEIMMRSGKPAPQMEAAQDMERKQK